MTLYYVGRRVLRLRPRATARVGKVTNIESGWIMVAQFYQQPDEPTVFDRVLAAQLDSDDWSFSGRAVGSRRTPTASIKKSGVTKLGSNPIYLDPNYRPRPAPRRRALQIQAEIVEE